MPTFYNFTDNSENLVSYSTYNASTWSNTVPSAATLTTGISAPDGSTNAVRFTCNNTASALLRVSFPTFTPNGTDTYTFSFFVKKISGSAVFNAFADMNDGTPSTQYNSQLITNQWVRISASGVPTATAKTFIDVFSDQQTDFVLDFWGLQLEKKSLAGAYVQTNGTIVRAGNGLIYSFDDVFVPADVFRNGNLWTWGLNANGQLGVNDTNTRTTPVQTFTQSSDWKQVTSGTNHTAAIKTDGTLWTFGLNTNGQLGVNDTNGRTTPVTTFAGGVNWKQVFCGGNHTAAIKTDGTLWTFGLNTNGQLGVNDTTQRNTPVTTFAGGANWEQVTGGANHTAAIKTDGTLWTWGLNSYGQLGVNDTTQRNTPVQTSAGGTNWKQVAGGNFHTTAIKTDGTLWTWGRNHFGQLGTNDATQRNTPVQTLAGGTNWKQVSNGANYVAAIKTDGTLWSWGQSGYGQMGVNDTTDRPTPVTTLAGGNNWKQVGNGANHTAAIKTNGTLWTWGRNTNGQLGTNDTTQRNTPVTTFLGGNNWKQVDGGANHTPAVTYIDPVI